MTIFMASAKLPEQLGKYLICLLIFVILFKREYFHIEIYEIIYEFHSRNYDSLLKFQGIPFGRCD